MKRKPFLTDERWRKLNYQKLVDLAEDEQTAAAIVTFLDNHPEVRADLAGIYFRAKETLRRSG